MTKPNKNADHNGVRELRVELARKIACDRTGAEASLSGPTTFLYGESRYLLTSVDLPIVSQIVEASEEAPCLASRP
jgi:hypothetical protein